MIIYCLTGCCRKYKDGIQKIFLQYGNSIKKMKSKNLAEPVLKEIKITGKKEGDVAYVYWICVTSNGEKISLATELYRENNFWKVKVGLFLQ